MTVLEQFDPIPIIQFPTIWIGLLWGLPIEYWLPDNSLAQLVGYSGQLIVNSHKNAGATNLATWDAAGGFFTFANTAPNIVIQAASAATRILTPRDSAYAYLSIVDGSDNGYAIVEGPIDIAYWGGA